MCCVCGVFVCVFVVVVFSVCFVVFLWLYALVECVSVVVCHVVVHDVGRVMCAFLVLLCVLFLIVLACVCL